MKVSIILPVFNEEKNIPKILKHLQSYRDAGHEVVVVDGSSTDNTLMLAHDGADAVIVSQRGRALQMNNGAAVATGDVLLFLHADTFLPENALALISDIAARNNFWGRFDVRLSSDHFIYRVIEWFINKRSALTSIATGDQAIFIERKLFDALGGFPEIPLMEDVSLSIRLKKITPPLCLKQQVITSSRRWEVNGVLSTVLLMWKLRFYYFLGVSPERLKQLYH